MHFGEALRHEREMRAVTLDEIAAATRVSMRHFRALESGSFAELPGGIFSRSIVRSYARFCGLDEDQTVERFLLAAHEAGLEHDAEAADLSAFAENVRRTRASARAGSGPRWFGLAAMLLTVAALALMTALVLHHRGMLPLPHHHEVSSAESTGAHRQVTIFAGVVSRVPGLLT